MYNDYLTPDKWSIIEEYFDPKKHLASESIFSIGNGIFGQRANFEEDYSGIKLEGNYVGGIFFPDKTKVGWWKIGYPSYFAKTVNCPGWINLRITVDKEVLDLNRCQKINAFRRELNMKEGYLKRTFEVTLQNGKIISVESFRFISLEIQEIGALRYSVKCLNADCKMEITSFINENVTNLESNWNEKFLATATKKQVENSSFLFSNVLKTDFKICSFSNTNVYFNNKALKPSSHEDCKHTFKAKLKANEGITIEKYGGYVSNFDFSGNLFSKSKSLIKKANQLGFDALLQKQIKCWKKIWDNADIEIENDVKAQQGIRFNIFHLNQTYTGQNPKLNVGPKGYTGEKYGGGTYWDTEAYCFPFYLSTKESTVAKNLLKYRYFQLEKAIKNAEKLGLNHGAALYPMVTVNGEECHNEWEITFEEIHRNISIIMAIKKYIDFTGDFDYMTEMGIEVLVAVSRFWAQRVSFSEPLQKYVILGVTGPNEYENNVNNNWYTNYGAKWCLAYTLENLDRIKSHPSVEIQNKINCIDIEKDEIEKWQEIIQNIYLPYSKKLNLYMQDDGFEYKELIPVDKIPVDQRPLNQHWSWDKILRSPYIKQGDVIQGFYFFENDFDKELIKKHFEFYEMFTVHESSLSASIHSVIASHINATEKAYNYFLRSTRLDLDDYNKEIEQGLHITSMAGSWLAVVEGFGGLKICDHCIEINPKIPELWNAYSFTLFYKNRNIRFKISKDSIEVCGQNLNEVQIKNNSDKKINFVEA